MYIYKIYTYSIFIHIYYTHVYIYSVVRILWCQNHRAQEHAALDHNTVSPAAESPGLLVVAPPCSSFAAARPAPSEALEVKDWMGCLDPLVAKLCSLLRIQVVMNTVVLNSCM